MGIHIHMSMNRVQTFIICSSGYVQMFIWMLNSVSDVHLVAHLRGGLTVDAGGEAEGGHAVPGVRPVNVVPKQYWHGVCLCLVLKIYLHILHVDGLVGLHGFKVAFNKQ